jgi:transketolase
VLERFEASGWVTVVDGHNEKSVEAALTAPKSDRSRVMIAVQDQIIGYGAPKRRHRQGPWRPLTAPKRSPPSARRWLGLPALRSACEIEKPGELQA